MGFDRTSDTDIAAVVELESLLTAPPWPVSSSLLDAFKVQETCRIGAPVDHYELDDILAPEAKRYKLYLMLNCFSLTNQERRLINERLRRDGATLVWMYAPGLFNPDSQPERSTSQVKALLGFGLDSERGEPRKLNMKLTQAGAQYFKGFAADRMFGRFERPEWALDKKSGGVKKQFPGATSLPERFYGADGGEVLARFEDGGKPSIAMRQTPQATDIWIGSVMAPADLLRSLARRAGCHLFCDADEIIYANKSFLAIHTREAGERTFNLRRKADVVEVFSGDMLAEGAAQFKDTMDAYRTRVYFLGDRAKWAAERTRADEFFARFQQELKALRQERASRPPKPVASPAKKLSRVGPYPLNKDGFVTTFLFCGPFPSQGAGESAAGYAADFVNERTVRPAVGGAHEATFKAAAGSPEAAEWFAGKTAERTLTNVWAGYEVTNETPYLRANPQRLHRPVHRLLRGSLCGPVRGAGSPHWGWQ
ncbi:MAG: hypothetical protein FJ272_11390 [Planctomycetes bacterium]|nr:hypothetical protein [Planctomycetota bacterium]